MSVSAVRRLPQFTQENPSSEGLQARLDKLRTRLWEAPDEVPFIIEDLRYDEEYNCFLDWVRVQTEEHLVPIFWSMVNSSLPISYRQEFLDYRVPRKNLQGFLEKVLKEGAADSYNIGTYFSEAIRLQNFEAMIFLLNEYPSLLFEKFATLENLCLAIKGVVGSKENDGIQILNRLMELIPAKSFIDNFRSLYSGDYEGTFKDSKKFLSEANLKKLERSLQIRELMRTSCFRILDAIQRQGGLSPAEWTVLINHFFPMPSGSTALWEWVRKNLPEQQQVSLALEIGLTSSNAIADFLKPIPPESKFMEKIMDQAVRELDLPQQKKLAGNLFSAAIYLGDLSTTAWLIETYPSFHGSFATSQNLYSLARVIRPHLHDFEHGVLALNRLVELLPQDYLTIRPSALAPVDSDLIQTLEKAGKFLSETNKDKIGSIILCSRIFYLND